MRKHLVLIVEAPAARMQRCLVQWCETNAVEASIERQLDHCGKLIAGEATRFGGECAAIEGARIAIGQIHNCHTLACVIDLLRSRDDFISEFNTGGPHS